MVVRRTRIALILALLSLAAASTAWAQSFDELSEEQQELLAPLADDWARIEPIRKKRLLNMADRVAGGTAEDRERFQHGLQRFMSLDTGGRQQVRRLFERFRHLPPEERREIIRRVMAMPEQERRAFAFGMRIADRTRPGEGRVEDYLRGLPPERRRALLQELQELSPPQKLRRIADEMDAGRLPQEVPGEDDPARD